MLEAEHRASSDAKQWETDQERKPLEKMGHVLETRGTIWESGKNVGNPGCNAEKMRPPLGTLGNGGFQFMDPQ